MTPQQIFDAWAPEGGRWSAWVKPVLFAFVESSGLPPMAVPSPGECVDRLDVAHVPAVAEQTALVIDLPDVLGLECGLQLARRGYRPIPLYNSAPGPVRRPLTAGTEVAVDMSRIVAALAAGASELAMLSLPWDAPPAFLLDARRRYFRSIYRPAPGAFDNRSISLVTDFPSGNLLLSAGIRRALPIQQTEIQPQSDLAHTLLRWQQAGIQISAIALNESAEPQPLTVRRPSRFRHPWQMLLATLGLRANPLGGFGGTLPEPGGG